MTVSRIKGKPTDRTHTADGSLTASELYRRAVQNAEAARVVTSCGKCAWRFDGSAQEGREAFRQHHVDAHGPMPRKRDEVARKRARREADWRAKRRDAA